MAFDRTRRASDPRQAAEAAFKAATTKAPDAPKPAERAPAAPLSRPAPARWCPCASTEPCWSISRRTAPAGRTGSTLR